MTEPVRIRATASEGMTQVRLMAAHPMETGRRRLPDGALVPAHYITDLTVLHNARVVLQARFGPSVSRDPYLVFSFAGGVPGDTVSVRWRDNRGEQRSDSVTVR
ncbi:thiosulfate oxidation carrier complex protein SoxZ [Denitromonas iodatirespirans]|uniref:Thiosulfate oxidation carrier complex protein SoxZ n=1 Tax=Denitromonas iodatirespirans TaxID=2795389 RepID=A0A944D7D6_DENI1|nr:thiosulfate oxidation carrier complex protein SoxZ [Denitromonas iodatirespirans]MBT0961190.1 thiosulfate oxidation carrier complex protein SoxZ [Denitromonas iodatirespirans]